MTDKPHARTHARTSARDEIIQNWDKLPEWAKWSLFFWMVWRVEIVYRWQNFSRWWITKLST
jgi:hypothetical protein